MIEQANIWEQLNWFAIQAKPHHEELAAARIARLDVEVFLPRARRWKLVCGVSRAITQPLFPGYFFARFMRLRSNDFAFSSSARRSALKFRPARLM